MHRFVHSVILKLQLQKLAKGLYFSIICSCLGSFKKNLYFREDKTEQESELKEELEECKAALTKIRQEVSKK